jgi:hypothetical protein
MKDEILAVEVPEAHRICYFCGLVVLEAQYTKYRKKVGGMSKKCLKGSAADRRARNAAKARWAKYRKSNEPYV